MTTLDDFFKPTDYLPPRLRSWKVRLGEPGTSATLEVFRPETDLGQSQAEMTLHFTRNGSQAPEEVVAWDDDLNAGLLQFGVKAISPEQETDRFALGLRAALRKPEREFGNGFFNSVLVDLLRDSDLTQYPEIAEVLKYVHANALNSASKTSDQYTNCREEVANAISGRAHELTELLKYPQEEAKRILVAALARYLDDRFSVSRRRRMGLLGGQHD